MVAPVAPSTSQDIAIGHCHSTIDSSKQVGADAFGVRLASACAWLAGWRYPDSHRVPVSADPVTTLVLERKALGPFLPSGLEASKGPPARVQGRGMSLRLKIDSHQSEQAHRGASRLLLISSGLSTCIKLVHQGYLYR